MKKALYKHMAAFIQARINCEKNGNDQWYEKHSDTLNWIESNLLPSGSGIDSGTRIDLDKSTGEKIVLYSSYHHMDEYGSYDGWSDFTVTIRPSLLFDINLTISGRFDKYADTKEYLHDVFDFELRKEYTLEYIQAG